MIDFLPREPLPAIIEVAEPWRDRPGGRFADKRHPCRPSFRDEADRGKNARFGAQCLD
jgi:hypothetical protein